MSTRHRAREYVLKALYAYEQGGQGRDEIADSVIGNSGLDPKALSFARSLFGLVLENIKSIDKYITILATNWRLDRIAVVDKNILRIAICEVRHMPDVPVKVAIDEAIELAKKYSTLESASFVNGILDRVLKEKGD